MLEKRGRRSIFKTGFCMKTHKPKSATFFLEFQGSCVICPFSVKIPLATAFFKKGGRGGPPPHKKEILKRLCTVRKRQKKRGGWGGPPPHKKEIRVDKSTQAVKLVCLTLSNPFLRNYTQNGPRDPEQNENDERNRINNYTTEKL